MPRPTEAQTQADAQRPAILDLQGQLAQAQAKQDELQRERDLADQEYRALADKVNQVKIAAEDAGGTVRVASRAAVPDRRAGTGRTVLALAGASAGLIAGLFLALVAQWWRGPQEAIARLSDRSVIERAKA